VVTVYGTIEEEPQKYSLTVRPSTITRACFVSCFNDVLINKTFFLLLQIGMRNDLANDDMSC
jgi:hypothetical protein